jgi:superfamily II DNA/RNA helicase
LSFQDLNLDSRLLSVLEANGFHTPTDIQRQAIPVALEGRDVMGSAQTGTGKTAAFVLPALQRLLAPSPVPGRGPRVLVLTPTRELASQVEQALRQLGRQVRLHSGTIVGGVPYPPQDRMLRQPLDFLVATPGRLCDHMRRGRLDFARLELLVLDEADRMLDMGFAEDVEQITAALPAERQTLLFSATFDGRVAGIARKLLKDPVRIEIAPAQQRHASIAQHMHQADDFKHKLALLDHLLGDASVTQAIVFVATKRGADEMALRLREQGHVSAALHGDMRQSARDRTIERMRRNRLKILVATDVAGRGLDIRGVSHVVNFDLPLAPEDYVHRIGRTGRGGADGIAVALVGPQDWVRLSAIERFLGEPLERVTIPGLEPRLAEPRSRSGRPNRSRKPNHHRGRPSGSFGKRPGSTERRAEGAPKHWVRRSKAPQ